MTGRARHTRGVMVPGVRPVGCLGGGGGNGGAGHRHGGNGGSGHRGGPDRRDRRWYRRVVVAVGAIGTREHHGQQSGNQEQQDGEPAAA
ncbi:hypothetical protein [Streptomyces tubercidicus]|nr:hypothetical protein [Streptomyces tubercidicus]WAU11245.1 hypothetical protein STRTU_001429 [Streptomyces tubercidicus]